MYWRVYSSISRTENFIRQTLREMALIKAPTGHEKKRAEYCVEWLQAQGIEEVLSDECTNVIVPWNTNLERITVCLWLI